MELKFKHYLRRCRTCHILFKSYLKYSKICYNCQIKKPYNKNRKNIKGLKELNNIN